MKTQDKSGIVRSFGAITVDNVGPSLNSKKWQAQVRQIVTSQYPAARGNNSLSDTLFPAQSFGVGQEYEEIRVTWIPVPLNTKLAAVKTQLAKFPEARLVKTLSLNPILSEEQIRAMETGVSTKTEEDYAEKFVIDAEGNPTLYHGHKQYRHISFSQVPKEDVDLRAEDLEDMKPVKMAKGKVPAARFFEENEE